MNRTGYKALIYAILIIISISLYITYCLLGSKSITGDYSILFWIFVVGLISMVIVGFLSHCAGEEIMHGSPAHIQKLKIGNIYYLVCHGIVSHIEGVDHLMILRDGSGKVYFIEDCWADQKSIKIVAGTYYEWTGTELITIARNEIK